MEEVKVWQGHPLSSVYPIVYFDALVAKSREEGPVTNKAWGLGNDCFRFRVEEQLNRPTAAKARGGESEIKDLPRIEINQSSLTLSIPTSVMNQCEEDIAVFPRYAIWANTVRDHIGAALVKLEDGETDKARRLLIHAHNSLSAFAEIQKPFDTILD